MREVAYDIACFSYCNAFVKLCYSLLRFAYNLASSVVLFSTKSSSLPIFFSTCNCCRSCFIMLFFLCTLAPLKALSCSRVRSRSLFVTKVLNLSFIFLCYSNDLKSASFEYFFLFTRSDSRAYRRPIALISPLRIRSRICYKSNSLATYFRSSGVALSPSSSSSSSSSFLFFLLPLPPPPLASIGFLFPLLGGLLFGSSSSSSSSPPPPPPPPAFLSLLAPTLYSW